jgi:hypothetical protein
MSEAFTPESFSAVLQGCNDFLIKPDTKLSNVDLFNLRFKCLGPDLSAVMKVD